MRMTKNINFFGIDVNVVAEDLMTILSAKSSESPNVPFSVALFGFTTTSDVSGVTNSYLSERQSACSRLSQMTMSASPTSSMMSSSFFWPPLDSFKSVLRKVESFEKKFEQLFPYLQTYKIQYIKLADAGLLTH